MLIVVIHFYCFFPTLSFTLEALLKCLVILSCLFIYTGEFTRSCLEVCCVCVEQGTVGTACLPADSIMG